MRDTELHINKLRGGTIFLSLVLFVMAWFTLHDMQTAEGIGLYYVLTADAGMSAAAIGTVAECIALFALLALLLLPCILFRKMNPESFLRIFTAYLAFMPSVSLAYLVHLPNDAKSAGCSSALLSGDLWSAFRQGVSGAAPLLSAGIPLLLLAAALLGRGKKKKAPLILFAVQILLLAAAIVFPALKDICNYFFRYLLLVYGFALWEQLYETHPQYQKPGWLIFGIFGLRGIYIMAELMSVYHV